MEIKQRRPRRSFKEIDEDILKAVEQLIEKVGISKLTIRGVCRKAGIELNVFYNRYNNLDELILEFAKRNDYWMHSAFDAWDITKVTEGELEPLLKKIFSDLAESLHKSRSMQELLLWALQNDSEATKKIGDIREVYTGHIVDFYSRYFEKKQIKTNLSAFSALMISGIYWLIINRTQTTYAGIDFRTEKGREILTETVNNLITNVFHENEKVSIAHKLKAEGIDPVIIAKCTGVDEKDF